jgi:hypothetical protein
MNRSLPFFTLRADAHFFFARFLVAFFLVAFFLAVFFLAAFFLAVFFFTAFLAVFFLAAFFLVAFLAVFFLATVTPPSKGHVVDALPMATGLEFGEVDPQGPIPFRSTNLSEPRVVIPMPMYDAELC